MSYAVRVTRAAATRLKALDAEAQETVLDLIDYLADEADALPQRPLSLQLEHSLGIADAFGTTLITLVADYDPPNRLLTIQSVIPH